MILWAVPERRKMVGRRTSCGGDYLMYVRLLLDTEFGAFFRIITIIHLL